LVSFYCLLFYQLVGPSLTVLAVLSTLWANFRQFQLCYLSFDKVLTVLTVLFARLAKF